MIRSLFLALALVFSFGCSAAASNNDHSSNMPPIGTQRLPSGHGAQDIPGHDNHVASKCYHTDDSVEYVVDWRAPKVNVDVRTLKGYRLIAFFEDKVGITLAHVADDCQHYFCEVEMPESKEQCKLPCVKTFECRVAHAHATNVPSRQ